MKWTSLLILLSLTASAQTNILTGRRVGVELRTNMVPYVTMGTVVEVRDPHDGTILRVIVPEPFRGEPPALPASAPGTLVISTNVLRRMPPALPTPIPRKARAALVPKSQHIGSIVCTKNNGGMIYHDGVKWILTNAMPVPRAITNAMFKIKVLPAGPVRGLPHGRITRMATLNTGTTVFPVQPFLADWYDDTEPSTRILYTDVTGLVAGRHYQLLGSIDAKTWQTIDAIDWIDSDPSSYWRSADAVTRTANFGEMLKIVSP